MKKSIFLTIIFLVGAAAFSQKQAVKPPFSKGVNFSLWFQTQGAGLVDDNFFTEQDFKNVKALGCDVIRLPINFENLSSGAPDYVIGENVFAILDKAVKWAGEQEIYLILDNHSGDFAAPTANDVEKRLLKYWPQIAARYKDSGKYVMYELLNEPHHIDNKKWGAIQQNVINAIRKIDSTHTIVVGGTEWTSYKTLHTLPNFSDGNLIYTFHYYDPMTFTHQGASWIDEYKRLKEIPFPYSKERMPKKPAKATKGEAWVFDNYKKDADLKLMEEVFENLADFSIKRNTPVWCGEFGVLMNCAPAKDRVEWYKTIAEFMDKRNIARTSWDYYDTFGLFKNGSTEIFPDDLNTELLTALKYNIPPKCAKNLSWDENAKKTGDYSIYKNGFAAGLRSIAWFEEYGKLCSLKKAESDGCFIDLPKVKPHKTFGAHFKGGAKFSQEKNAGYALEVEARTKQSGIKIQAYFENSNKTGEEWRAAAEITSTVLPPDGEWHKIRIPLKDFADIGAWNNEKNVWVNSRGLFDWDDIQRIMFENQAGEITNGVGFREIRLVK